MSNLIISFLSVSTDKKGRPTIKSKLLRIDELDQKTYDLIIDCLWERCSGACFWTSGAKILYNNSMTRECLDELEQKVDLQRYPYLRGIKGFWSDIADNFPVGVYNHDFDHAVHKNVFAEQLIRYCSTGDLKSFSTVIWNKYSYKFSQLNLLFRFYSFGRDALKRYVGEADKAQRVCRFCGRTGKEYFKEIAHAIPESLGNKLLFCNDECDCCNHDLGQIEDNFLRVMDFRRAIYSIHRKNSKDCPHIKGENYRFQSDENGNPLLYIFRGDIPPYDEDTDEILYCFRHLTKVEDEKIYKALCKMVIDLLPSEELPHFKKTIDWIANRYASDYMPDHKFAINPDSVFYAQPCLDILLNKRGMKGPYCTGILYIYDAIYAWTMPLVDADNGNVETEAALTQHWNTLSQILQVNWQDNNSSGNSKVTPYANEFINLTDPRIMVVDNDNKIFDYLHDCQPDEKNLVFYPPFKEDGISWEIKRVQLVNAVNQDIQSPPQLTFVVNERVGNIKVQQTIPLMNGTTGKYQKLITEIDVWGMDPWHEKYSSTGSFSADASAFRKLMWICMWEAYKEVFMAKQNYSISQTIGIFRQFNFNRLLAMQENCIFTIITKGPLSKKLVIKGSFLWGTL